MTAQNEIVPVGTRIRVVKDFANEGYTSKRNERKVGDIYEVTSITLPKQIVKCMNDTSTVYHLTALKRNGELSKRVAMYGSYGLSYWFKLGVFEIVEPK